MPDLIEGTYKDRDVEGWLDIYFYRRIGFVLAQFFARLGFTPTGVTLLSGLFGLAAGHLYYYRDLRLNLLGMALHILSNAFDNADGQLARLTKSGSRQGRIIDSLSDHLVFVGIYLHLVLRCLAEGASPAIWLLALGAGVSHAAQGGFADYARNAYLFFVTGKGSEFDSSSRLRTEYDELRWRHEPWSKFLLRTYLNFTVGQERFAPSLKRLRAAASRVFPDGIPASIQTSYREAARPLCKWIDLLMTNTRMLILFLVLILAHPAWYFVVELTALNLLLVFLLRRQDQICRQLQPVIEQFPA